MMVAVPKSVKGLDIMEIVNRRFKEFRELLRLSEEEFAEKTGIKPDRIKKIEDGCTKVRLEEVLAVSDCFGLSNDYLLGIEEQPRPILHNEEEALLWRRLQKLSEGELQKVIEALEEQEKGGS